MPSKILELRRKVSGSFNHNDSLSYVRTNWSGIDGKPSVYTPAGHTHPWIQVTGKPEMSAQDGDIGVSTVPVLISPNVLAQTIVAWAAPINHTHTWAQVTGKPSVIIEGDSRLTNARPSNDVAAWAKSGNSSVIPAGKVGSNSSLESSDKFLTNAQTFKYVSKSDVGLANVPNVDATNPANISQSASYRFVTDNEKNTWNNKWKQIYAGTSGALSKTGTTAITVPSDVYVGKPVAIEIRYGTNSSTTYTNKIVFVTLGTDSTTGDSKTHPRYVSFSEFDGRYLKNISAKCYVAAGTTTIIRFGYLKTLMGSFSGTHIDWTTQSWDNTNVYIGKIWVLE